MLHRSIQVRYRLIRQQRNYGGRPHGYVLARSKNYIDEATQEAAV